MCVTPTERTTATSSMSATAASSMPLPRVWERLGRGEEVPHTDYYLRGAPMFETAVDTPYSWLNNIVAVSVGKQEALGVTYDVYQML